MAEEIIVSIKIDEEEAQQRLIQIREKMEELTKTKKQLAEAYKEGWITQEQYAEQLATTEVSMRGLKTEMTNLTKGQDVNNNSINALREQTRRLTQERNNLDLSTVQGRKRLEEINVQLDENTEKIRANMDAATQQKMNIGNYKDALGELFPAFGDMNDSLDKVTKGFDLLKDAFSQIKDAVSAGFDSFSSAKDSLKSLEETSKTASEGIESMKEKMTEADKASEKAGDGMDKMGDGMDKAKDGANAANKSLLTLVANPIGAVLAAIVAVVYLLYKAFTQTSAGADMIEEAMASVSAILDVLMDRLGQVAGALVDFFSGDFSGAAEKMSNAVSGIGEEMANASKEAVALKRATNDLEDAQIDFNVASAETENKIKRLLIQAKDRTLTEEERMKKIEEATALEKGRVDQEIKLADQALNIASREAAQRLNIVKKANETEIEFGKRVLEAFKADNAAKADDLRDNVAKMLIARENADGKSLEFQEKLNQKAEDLETKAQEKREKAAEKARQVWEKETKARVDFQLYGLAQKAKTIEEEKVIDDASLESFKQKEKNRLDILIQIEQKILEEIKKNTQLTKTERELAVQKQNDKIIELNKDYTEKVTQQENNLKSIREKNAQDLVNLETFRLESKAKAQKEDVAGTEESYRLLVEAEKMMTTFLLQNDQLTATERELIKAQSDDRLVQMEKDKADKLTAINEKQKQDEQAQELAKKTFRLEQAKGLLSGLQGFFKEGTAAAKAAALADIAVNTALGYIQGLDIAQKAAKAMGPAGVFLLPVFYAAQVGQVLSAANKAKGLLGFAEGGLTGTRIEAGHGIPITRSNGDNILATVRTGEVILNQRQQAALGGSATFRRIGVPGFADGGLVSDISLANASRSIGVNDIIAKMNEQKTVLVLQDFEAAAFSKFDADRAAVV